MRNHTRTHYFRDENDDRTVVNSTMVMSGDYRAIVTEGLYNELGFTGYGHSRLAAIVDLYAKIKMQLEQSQ
jgi:hypothetical protein